MKKIRVVHIVPMLSPGGAERVAIHIVRGLNRQLYEPVVISYTGRLDCELDRLLDEAGIEVHYLGKRPGFDYRMYYRLAPVLKECKPDILHTHLHVLRYAMPFLVWRKNVPVLHTVHNLAEREIETGMRWMQRYALHHGVVPVAVAQEVALSVEGMYGLPTCRVITNGIPTQSYASPQTPRKEWRAREGFGQDDILFVCVARFAPQKNHELLLKAFAEGPARDPRAHLVLVGEGVLREKLQEQTKSLGLANQVHFLGLRTDIPDVLGAMDVFVLSSDWEGNPLSVMEAMASGLPIVSTAAGGVPDMFEHGKEGYVVPIGDAAALAHCMNTLLREGEAARSLGAAAGRRAKEKYDVSTMVRAYEEAYEQLIQQAARAKTAKVIPVGTRPVQQVVGSRNR
jgi:glycosyltransferase involved in cell wall biosynthesis